MVLSDEHKLVSQLMAVWRARTEELRENLAEDPTSESSWLWTIRLRIYTYLTRRYDQPHGGDRPEDELELDREARRSAPPSPAIGPRPAPRPSIGSVDERARRERFRHRCHDALLRIRPLVADARTDSLTHAAEQLRLARERRRRQEARRRRSWFAAMTRRRYE